jgi:hypothetical protein
MVKWRAAPSFMSCARFVGSHFESVWITFELMQTTYITFMYYYKFVKVVNDKIAYKNTISTNINL